MFERLVPKNFQIDSFWIFQIMMNVVKYELERDNKIQCAYQSIFVMFKRQIRPHIHVK